MSNENWPLGVFASVNAGFGVQFDVAKALGVPTMHLHAPHEISDSSAEDFSKRLEGLGIQPTIVFAGFEGESYESIPIVKETVGLVPLATRAERLEILKRTIDFSSELNVNAVGLHVGFVPHDNQDADYALIVKTLQKACDYAAQANVNIHLETGQEPANILLEFLQAVDRPNLFINFDPANMILYGCGEPLPALELLGSHVRSVHCKDAKWSDKPGDTWGEEVPLGQGDVDMKAYLETLAKIGYTGPLTIEREISQEPERQQAEIGHAVDLLTQLKTELAAEGTIG